MRIDMHTNEVIEEITYFIVDKKTCIIVDPGSDFEEIDAYIQKNSFENIAVYLTHGHFDHTLSVKPLYEKYKLNVYVSEKEMELIRLQPAHIDKETGSKLMLDNYTYITDSIDFHGIKLNIFEVPGHTKGHTMAEVVGLKALMTGDFVFQGTVGRCDLPTGSFPEMKQSLKKLSAMDYNLKIYPGHGPSTTLRDEMKNNEYLVEYNK